MSRSRRIVVRPKTKCLCEQRGCKNQVSQNILRYAIYCFEFPLQRNLEEMYNEVPAIFAIAAMTPISSKSLAGTLALNQAPSGAIVDKVPPTNAIHACSKSAAYNRTGATTICLSS